MTVFIPSTILTLLEEMKQTSADIARVNSPEGLEHYMKEYIALRNQLTIEMEEFAEFRAFEIRKRR